jgi:hypothetical protein
MKLSFTALATLWALVIPNAAYAHPGHGSEGSNALHYLADHPFVALTIIGSLAIVAWRRNPSN